MKSVSKQLYEYAEDFCNDCTAGTLRNFAKAVEELEQQIEKMKCCQNCNNYIVHIGCNDRDMRCNNFDKWQLKE